MRKCGICNEAIVVLSLVLPGDRGEHKTSESDMRYPTRNPNRLPPKSRLQRYLYAMLCCMTANKLIHPFLTMVVYGRNMS
jgi:hypothetical protein